MGRCGARNKPQSSKNKQQKKKQRAIIVEVISRLSHPQVFLLFLFATSTSLLCLFETMTNQMFVQAVDFPGQYISIGSTVAHICNVYSTRVHISPKAFAPRHTVRITIRLWNRPATCKFLRKFFNIIQDILVPTASPRCLVVCPE